MEQSMPLGAAFFICVNLPHKFLSAEHVFVFAVTGNVAGERCAHAAFGVLTAFRSVTCIASGATISSMVSSESPLRTQNTGGF